MNNIDMRNLKLHKLLYSKIDFLNNINKAVGEYGANQQYH